MDHLDPRVGIVDRADGDEVGRIFREESGRSLAALIRAFGDIDVPRMRCSRPSPSPWAGGRTTACRPTLAAGPAGQLVVTANGARTLIGQLVEVSLPFLKRHLLPAS